MATVFTSVGEAKAADLWDGTASAPANYYIGWGTGAGAPAKGSTDVSTPATEARVVGVESQPLADKNQFVGTLTADGGKTITNAGLFDAAGSGSPPSGGTCCIVGDHAGVALLAGDKIEYTITLEWT
ncbi:MAG: hypothetical protein CV089_02200 [Nitrospira sp. WS110]|nr:hypothetical protein [Nitrospira sp. WS110]